MTVYRGLGGNARDTAKDCSFFHKEPLRYLHECENTPSDALNLSFTTSALPFLRHWVIILVAPQKKLLGSEIDRSEFIAFHLKTLRFNFTDSRFAPPIVLRNPGG